MIVVSPVSPTVTGAVTRSTLIDGFQITRGEGVTGGGMQIVRGASPEIRCRSEAP